MARYVRRDRTIQEVAERRHQEVLQGITSQAEENHRSAVAQLTGEAVRALDEQAQGHAHATEQLRREAIVFQTEATQYVSKQQAAEAQAKATHDELLRSNASRVDVKR